MVRNLTNILNGLLFCALPLASALAQTLQFQREVDTIPVMINGVLLSKPFVDGLDNSTPTFADIDNDGDVDLFVGEGDGNINFYRNTGTASNPIFTLETENLVSDVGAYSAPTLADIDNDGDFDLFVGENDGNINFYRNAGTASNPTFVIETENFASIHVGGVSTPTFVDIDNDGDLDLLVGDGDRTVNFYRNTGTASNSVFVLETESFVVSPAGFINAPTFADIDNDGDFDLFVGAREGNINFWRNTVTASNPSFTLETQNFASIDVGNFSTPTFSDIDNDDDFDLIIGETDGNMNFYRNTGVASNPIFAHAAENLASIDVGSFSTPTFADIDNDGDADLFVGEGGVGGAFGVGGNINFYRNTGTASNPIFTLETVNLASINVGSYSTPAFTDIDNDGDLDLFVGELDRNINFYRNTGAASNPIFALETENFVVIDVGVLFTPTFADIDNDGDFDLFVGEGTGNINFFRNTGTASNPVFVFETENFASIDVGFESAPTLADIDNDNDFDLFVGVGTAFGELSSGKIDFFRNTGTASNPIFTFVTANLASIDVGDNSTPTFTDIDNDGDSDLFVGQRSGGLYFYRNVTPTSVSSRETEGIPNTFELNQNYPNPFNPETTIQYQLPKTTQVKLIVYNLVGHQVATLVDQKQQAGFYSVDWDGKDDLGKIVASGIYLYRLETKEFVKVRKLTLIR